MRSLVIDDEADARARLVRLLGAHPEVAVVGEAHDGLEAIEKIEELRPDLLFLDIEMPGLKGFEVVPCGEDDERDLDGGRNRPQYLNGLAPLAVAPKLLYQ